MTRMSALVASLLFIGTVVFAHGGNDHVRGIVMSVSAQSVTVQMADKSARTLALTDKTTFARAGKAALLADVKVGDRVVIDVPEKTSTALLIQIGAAAKAPAHK